MVDGATREKLWALIWTSANEVVEKVCGEYVSLPEASADRIAAIARFEAEHAANWRDVHDIAAGTWRIVGIHAGRYR